MVPRIRAVQAVRMNQAAAREGLRASREGPSLLRKVSPSYPAFAREREKQGTVLLRISIDEHGRPVGIEVIKKAGFGFDEEAVRAVGIALCSCQKGRQTNCLVKSCFRSGSSLKAHDY